MKTLALIIGNNNYRNSQNLINAVNDAKSVAEKFVLLGYDVILKNDCNISDAASTLTEFSNALTAYDVGIFFFAGHAFQIDSENYLAAIDCPFDVLDKLNWKYHSIPLNDVINILKEANNQVNIIILDACRDNPFNVGSRGFSSNELAPIFAPRGTLIAFSTSPGEKSKDAGIDNHSIYTGAILKHIDEKFLSIEEFFKRVRTTVYNLSGGTQTSWEHTSLIGDFFFNRGQLAYSLSLPYDESVVKDNQYIIDGSDISFIIRDLKSCDWNKQNPAIHRFLRMNVQDIDKNQQFILGRNILQSSGHAFEVQKYVEDLANKILKFSINGENHVLNGILFEIYFNSYGEFRVQNFKNYHLDLIFPLQINPVFVSSFKFIQNALIPYVDNLFYIPDCTNNKRSVDIKVKEEEIEDFSGSKIKKQRIERVVISTKDITVPFLNKYSLYDANEETLKVSLSDYLTIPQYLLQVNSNIPITNAFYDRTKASTSDNDEWNVFGDL
ncbi:MAG: caspase family protein [Bacteroidales bacterium]|jgi:hypothetical protein|nr:caspase family protein [Bacteroidales bacterium]